MSDSNLISKIQKLLDLAERAGTQHESDLAFQRAQEMMTRHAIDEAMLKREDQSHEIVHEVIDLGTPDGGTHALFRSVATANNCFSFATGMTYKTSSGKYRDKYAHRTIYGTQQDIDFVKLLYTSLALRMTTNLLTMRELMPGEFSGKAYGHSFRLGFAASIAKRLSEAKRRATNDTPGAAVALFDKRKAAQDLAEDVNDLKPGKSVSISHGRAYEAGREHGKRADISGGRNNLRERPSLN